MLSSYQEIVKLRKNALQLEGIRKKRIIMLHLQYNFTANIVKLRIRYLIFNQSPYLIDIMCIFILLSCIYSICVVSIDDFGWMKGIYSFKCKKWQTQNVCKVLTMFLVKKEKKKMSQ